MQQQYWDQLVAHLDRTKRVKMSKIYQLLESQPAWNDRPEQMLLHYKLITREELLRAKSELMGVPAAPLDVKTLDPAVVWSVPQAMAQRYRAVCIGREDGRLVLAMVDPNDAFALDYIQMRTGYELDRRVAYAGDVESVVQNLYTGGPPVGRAPGSIRERVGQEVVRGRTLDTVALTRPRVLDDDAIHETPPAAPKRIVPTVKGPRVALGAVPAPAAARTVDVGIELARLSLDLIAELDEDALIDKMLDTAMRLFPVDAASLLLIDWEHSKLFFREARGPGKREILDMSLPLDPAKSVAAWCFAHREPVNIPDVRSDPRHCADIDRELGYVTRSLLAVPVLWGDEVLGVIELLNRADGPFSSEEVEQVKIVAAQVALALHNTMAMRQLHNFYHQSIETLIDCYQAFDPVSRHHVVDVASLATAMGREIGLSAVDMETLSYAGLLHDLGKIRCADPNDMQHVEEGASMLAQVTLFNRITPIVRYHHERHDGSGPHGLAGEAVPLLARLLSVAEAWCEEALPSIYSGVPVDEALQTFEARFGQDFDPALLPAFTQAYTLLSNVPPQEADPAALAQS